MLSPPLVDDKLWFLHLRGFIFGVGVWGLSPKLAVKNVLSGSLWGGIVCGGKNKIISGQLTWLDVIGWTKPAAIGNFSR